MSNGIDYGNGITNINKKTGIRYGVISQNEVLQAWADESQSTFPDCECEAEFLANCDGESNDGDWDCYCEPIGFNYAEDGYEAHCGEDSDIFITNSEFYTRANFCAPGACFLMDPNHDAEKAYCFDHDWFEDGVAPYPVWRVTDDMFIEPKK